METAGSFGTLVPVYQIIWHTFETHNPKNKYSVSHYLIASRVWLKRVLVWMIEFIATYTFTTPDYRQYGAIAILHTFQFTVTHALGFSVFTSRILATDL
jgi:hypothetical protein